MPPVIGLDVGGANLKAAHTGGAAVSRPFALWKDPAGLAAALRGVLAELPAADRLAVTMTGEQCDCYESKRQGVAAILDAVERAADGRTVRVWRTDGRFSDAAAARKDALLTASANWLALATFAARHAPKGPALLLDIGTTTTDVIPLLDGKPTPRGRTDPQRLNSGELVYKGWRRTPVCALMAGGGAAELFATTHDVYLLLGAVPEDANDRDTADGRPATKAAAHARLARMLGADLETSTEKERLELASLINLRLVKQVVFAVEQVAGRLPGPPETVIVAGSGDFLARVILIEQQAFPPCDLVGLSYELSPAVSAAACAYAVAVLLDEMSG
jgi:(4-(4-[2-(gamma-L-glutamylamino)ethyl]phenoxymethyl)furan-2-yl)methanamine synthase